LQILAQFNNYNRIFNTELLPVTKDQLPATFRVSVKANEVLLLTLKAGKVLTVKMSQSVSKPSKLKLLFFHLGSGKCCYCLTIFIIPNPKSLSTCFTIIPAITYN
jgi:hypothetical protein